MASLRSLFIVCFVSVFFSSSNFTGANAATGDYVISIDWGRFTVGQNPGDSDAIKSRGLLLQACKYNLGWLNTFSTDGNGLYVISSYVSDNLGEGPRHPAEAAMAIAVALMTGIYDPAVTGVSQIEATDRAVKMIKSIAYWHKDRIPSGWGNSWQSALWAAYAGQAGWMLWSSFDTTYRNYIAGMVEYEANRFNTYTVPYYKDRNGTVIYPGDSKAEENSWNASLMQIAISMMPTHPNITTWKSKGCELMVSAYARPSDVNNTATVIDGKTLTNWLNGSNAEENGSLVNHDLIHDDYMAAIEFNLRSYLAFSLAQISIPQSARFNSDIVYDALVDLNFSVPPFQFPGGTMYISGSETLYYPTGTDWSRYRFDIFYCVDAFTRLLGLDTLASTGGLAWERLRAARLQTMQARHTDGHLYAAGEWDNYSGKEQLAAQQLADAYLLKWLISQGALSAVASWNLGAEILTVNSSDPSSGVSITVSPNDNGNDGDGTTPFTRIYDDNTQVTLAAPATAGGNNFEKWRRNGVDWSTTLSTSVTLDADYTMTAVYVVPPPVIPPAPVGLAATTASSSQINLNWTDVGNETGYRVKRSTTSGGPYTQVGGDLAANTISFGNMGLSADTTYYYVVTAFNSSGESPNSDQASATTLSSGACATSTGGSAWVNTAFSAQTGPFTAEFDATPSTGTDNAVVGLSYGSATHYASQACIVRFRDGHVDARNGSSYSAASTINYTAGTAYHFRLVVNLSLHTYSIYVTPAGGSEILVGSSYALRTEQNAVTQLDNWAVYADTAGSVQVCNFLATPSLTLTVNSSNPSSGVSITVSPNDNTSQGGGATSFMRTYNNNTVVTLTAPAAAGGNNFAKWQRDGADWSTTLSTSVTLDAAYTMTAVYVGGCTPTALVTGTTLGTIRNNYSGWVGMRLQVGASPLTVQSLGRIFVNGNSGNHELRLVLAATKATVASVVWTPSSGVHNQIKYAPLSAAVTLTANTEYYLASLEVSGGDQWYSFDTTVTTTSAAAVLSGIYSPSATTWTPNGTAGRTYVPVSLQYCGTAGPVVVTVTPTDATAGEPATGQGTGTLTFSRTGSTAAALTVNFTVGGTATSGVDYTALGTSVGFAAASATATKTVTVINDALVEGDETVALTLASGPGYTVGSLASATVTIKDDDDGGCTPTALVTGMTLGTLRNNYSGWVGMRLQVGASPLTVQSLGRIYLNGNGGNHELRLVLAATKATVASVVWTPSGGVHNQIKYAPLSAAVTLTANTEYYLASLEVSGGDQWYSFDTTVTTTSAAAVLSGIYSPSATTWTPNGTAGRTYVPVSLQYCGTAGPVVVTVTPTDATAGEPATGQGTGTLTFSRTGSTAAALTANFTVGGTAASGVDYTALGTSLAFVAGSATATKTVNVIDDALVEGDETIVLTLASGPGYTVGSPASATVTIKDDDGGCTPTALVTGMTLGTLRNNYSGWVGMRLQVGASPLTVQSLGRIFVNGNTGNHELRLVLATTKATVASVVWTPSGGLHNQIKYAPLSAAVTLTANTEYYLASREVSGGDQWYSFDTTVTTTSAAAVLSGIYSPNATTWTPNGTAGHTYVPVSLQYCGTAASVLTVSGAPLSEGGVLQARSADRSALSIIVEGGFYANKKVVLRIVGGPGERYILQSSDNLVNWTPISTHVIENQAIELYDTNAGAQQGFYRLVPVSDVADR